MIQIARLLRMSSHSIEKSNATTTQIARSGVWDVRLMLTRNAIIRTSAGKPNRNGMFRYSQCGSMKVVKDSRSFSEL